MLRGLLVSRATIADINPEVFWPCRTWTQFAALPDKERRAVILPFFGIADWGIGHPMDVEEILGTAILNAAFAHSTSERLEIVAPPVRFVPAPFANQAFGLDSDTVYQHAHELLESIQASGFTRVILFNTSPWGETFIDVTGRDTRIQLGLQLFCINLSGLGLDLNPGLRQEPGLRARLKAQTLATYLLEKEPVFEADPTFAAIPVDASSGELQPHGPLLTDFASLATARTEGPRLLKTVGAELAGLLDEIAARPPLPDNGRWPRKTRYP
ncbi:MAG: hypothetical protein ACFBZ8_05965 [Opitutales bacterium]